VAAFLIECDAFVSQLIGQHKQRVCLGVLGLERTRDLDEYEECGQTGERLPYHLLLSLTGDGERGP
jgi:hypothetical protein